MLNIDEVGDVHNRIDQLVDYFCKGNKAAFGRGADIQSGVLAGIIGGRKNKPSFEVLQKLLTAYPTVNPHWLIFGRGPMLQGERNNDSKPVLPFPLIALEAELSSANAALSNWRTRLHHIEKGRELILEELANAEADLSVEQKRNGEQRSEDMLKHEEHRVSFANSIIEITQVSLEAAQDEVRRLRALTSQIHRQIAQILSDEEPQSE